MNNITSRIGWAVACILALALAASWAGIARGGSLDPPAPPASTMKTLDEIPGSWHRRLDAATGCSSARFQCVFFSSGTIPIPAAVLDRETGLVWQRSPTETSLTFFGAQNKCFVASTGGRGGWRLPTAEELFSLPDPATGELPTGHPFVNVSSGFYWTATTGSSAENVFTITLFGSVVLNSRADPALVELNVWCVRGGPGASGM